MKMGPGKIPQGVRAFQRSVGKCDYAIFARENAFMVMSSLVFKKTKLEWGHMQRALRLCRIRSISMYHSKYRYSALYNIIYEFIAETYCMKINFFLLNLDIVKKSLTGFFKCTHSEYYFHECNTCVVVVVYSYDKINAYKKLGTPAWL